MNNFIETFIEMNRFFITIILVSMLASCKEKAVVETVIPENQDHLIASILWFQSSAEMQALFYQGYNAAKASLSDKIKKRDNKKPKAVIMDIDETILDNSPVETLQVKGNLAFSDSLWLAWVNKASAELLPGAKDFIRFADSVGVEVFYLSNRESKDEFLPTLNNLIAKGLPFADSIHLVLRDDLSSKEIRRGSIAEKYDILLLIGDNLADFDQIFDARGDDLGFGAVKNYSKKFGRDFIILPNPMYGPWMNASIKNLEDTTIRAKLIRALK